MVEPVTTMAVAAAVGGAAASLFGGFLGADAEEEAAKARQALLNAQAQSTKQIGKYNATATRDAAQYTANMLERQALNEEAMAQREYIAAKRQEGIMISNMKAKAGKSGGGVSDKTIIVQGGRISREMGANALAALYSGDSSAAMLRSQGSIALYEGKMKSDMILYEASQQAEIMKYQGQVERFEGKANAQAMKWSAIGDFMQGIASAGMAGKKAGMFGGGGGGGYGTGLSAKYAPTATAWESTATQPMTFGSYG